MAPYDIIRDLKQMHNLMVGSSTGFGVPLFEQLTREVKRCQGHTFDTSMASLFAQFQAVIALEMRVVRMLRSFLAYSQEDLDHEADVKAIFEDLRKQRTTCDPLSDKSFQWYCTFKIRGGYYYIKALKPNEFLYMESGNGRISGSKAVPGREGYFEIKPCEQVGSEGAFLLSAIEYPYQYMQLNEDEEDGDVMKSKNSSITQCHWYFHVHDVDSKVFKLRTVKWSRYVYMQDDWATDRGGPTSVHESIQVSAPGPNH